MDDLSEMAESIAIIMDDMGHPIPAYNHWVIWNIPAISLIPENIPHGEQVDSLGAIQGCGYGKHRYREMCIRDRGSTAYMFSAELIDT